MPDILERIKEWPGIQHLRRRKYDREFEFSHDNLFRGSYDTFAQALSNTPNSKPVGYDNPDPPQMYREVMSSIRGHDYPVLFWLKEIIDNVGAVLDFGGHVGILYYGFSKLMQFPPELRWVVYDVPAVLEEGARLAIEKQARQLTFTSDLESVSNVDVFLASGSPQYVEEPLIEIVNRLKKRPKYVILNMIPLHPHREIITVNNMDVVYCPYKISHLDNFVSSFIENGFVLQDQWVNDNKRCRIPFCEDAKGIAYYGMVFSTGS